MGRLITLNEFPVDTNGHCFICLSKASPPSQFNSDGLGLGSAAPYSSVHALSQYLKMDMSKVFHEKESIPSDLLDNVRRSKLKVSLCGQCSKWNNRIMELCRQLEKIETEVTFYLGLIQVSLLRSGEDNKSNLLYKFGKDMNTDGGLLEKVRIVEALRTEALERCTNKLETEGRPQVKIRNLTAKQVVAKKQRVKSKSRRTAAINNRNEGNCSKSAINYTDGEPFKTEGSEKGKDDYVDDEGDFESMDHTISEDGGDFNYAGINEGDNLPIHQSQPTTAIKTETNRDRANVTVSKASGKVLPPTASTKNVPKLTYEINPETGKFKCSICSAELIQKCQLTLHYKSVHLKIKHKCNLCGKEFSQKANYNSHC